MEANKTCASTGGNILRITTAEMLNDVVWTVSQTGICKSGSHNLCKA